MKWFGSSKDKESTKKRSNAPKAKESASDVESKEERHDVPTNVKDTGSAPRVLVRPLITEKSTHLSTTGAYAFEVAKNANKIHILDAVKRLYGVTPVSVRVLNVRGKLVRSRSGYGKRKSWKKAIVTLKKGESIEVTGGVKA